MAKEVETDVTEETLQKALDGLDNLIKAADAKDVEEKDEKDEDEEKVEKSFVKKATSESEELKKGVEVSDFLAELVNQIGESVDSTNHLVKSQQRETNKNIVELAKSLKGIGEALSGVMERIEAVEKTPVSPRKSVLSKSEKGVQRFEDVEVEMSKSQILNKMTNLVEKGDPSVNADDVIRFESTGRMRPEIKETIYN